MTANERTRPLRPRLVRRERSPRSTEPETTAAPPTASASTSSPTALAASAAPTAPARPTQPQRRSAATQPPARYDTQFIPFWFVGRVVQLAVWFGCAISFAIGTVGNIGLFGGDLRQANGWPYVTSSQFLIPLVPSTFYQFVVQMFQFYAARKYGQSSWQYRATLAFSVAPSCWTYGLIVVPWVWSSTRLWWGEVWLVRLPTIAILLIAALVVVVLNDMIQEWILVKQEG